MKSMKSIYFYITVPIVMMVLLVTILTNVIIQNINRSILPQIESLTLDTITAKANEISLWIDTRIKEAEYLEGTVDWLDFDIRKKHIWMRYLADSRYYHAGHYETIGYITLDGVNHVSDGSIFYVRDREYMQRVMKEGTTTVISNPIISKGNEEKIILIVTKIIDSTGMLKGYLTCAISSAYLEQVLAQANAYDFPCYIINEDDGTIIAGDQEDAIQQGKGQVIRVKIPGTSNWHIVMQIPREAVNGNIQETILMTIIFSVLTIASVIFISQKYNRYITQQIRRLETHMGRVREGELVSVVPDHRIKEFNSLGKSYNEMIENMEGLLEEVSRQEKLKRDAENKALYAQIKPHFLYNTLETIQAMAYNNDDEPVEEAIGNLATLFRMSLTSNRQIITLKEEITHLESYLKIQLLRYTKQFDYTINTDHVNLKLPYMKFTFQPLVENAIYHGVRLMDQKGRIDIVVKEEGECLIAEIRNTYKQIDPVRIGEINHQLASQVIYGGDYNGHGLYNVNERLKINFGKQYGVHIEASDQLCIVRVIHPIIQEERNEHLNS